MKDDILFFLMLLKVERANLIKYNKGREEMGKDILKPPQIYFFKNMLLDYTNDKKKRHDFYANHDMHILDTKHKWTKLKSLGDPLLDQLAREMYTWFDDLQLQLNNNIIDPDKMTRIYKKEFDARRQFLIDAYKYGYMPPKLILSRPFAITTIPSDTWGPVYKGSLTKLIGPQPTKPTNLQVPA